ncbi:hypothetical protein BH23BAC1_BH23BAC1_21190 [soil metagenome]
MNRILGAFLNFLYNDIISHIPLHLLRLNFLRLFNKNISKSAVILMHSRILNFWKITIGDRTVINQNCLLDCRIYRIFIEHDVDIGPYTKIWTLGHDPDSPSHELYGGDVSIQHHSWIASGVTILPNIRIGKGAVVASSSVVTKNVDDLHVIGGNPAKYLKMRTNNLNYKLNFKPLFE